MWVNPLSKAGDGITCRQPARERTTGGEPCQGNPQQLLAGDHRRASPVSQQKFPFFSELRPENFGEGW